MQQSKIVTLVASIALCGALSACGGGSSNNNAPAASPTPTSVAYAEQNALPLAVAAKIPPGLKCSSADIVWVNMHTKAFHDPGDPYYGKTKNGAYMCRATAVADGDHPAGSRHTHMGSQPNTMMAPGATMAPGETMAPGATPTPHRRRHQG